MPHNHNFRLSLDVLYGNGYEFFYVEAADCGVTHCPLRSVHQNSFPRAMPFFLHTDHRKIPYSPVDRFVCSSHTLNALYHVCGWYGLYTPRQMKGMLLR